MNLYHVLQSENNDWDTFSDFVVAAPDVKTARQTSPTGGVMDWGETFSSWASSPAKVKVKLIGIAEEGVEGVICASFHAG